MSGVLNDCDALLQAADVRFISPINGAKIVTLTPSAQVFRLNKAGVSDRASITLTAVGQNTDGVPAFQVVSGVAPLTNGADASQKVVSVATMTTDTAVVEVTLDGQSDRVTIVKLRDGADGPTGSTGSTGANAIAAVLSNESHTLAAAADGTTGSLAGAVCSMTVYNGIENDTSNWSFSFAPASSAAALSYSTSNSQVTVTALAAGVDSAFVDITATRTGFASITKRFTVSKSRAGGQGPQGVQGPKGADGLPTYTWIKYADTAAGAGMSNDPTGKLYVGFAQNRTTEAESSVPGDYLWSLIKGEQGAQGNQGVQGPTGPNGQPTYMWVKYSDNADGTALYDTPTANTLYIGIAPNKTVQAESDNKLDYIWSRFKGETGGQGPQGVQGPIGPNGQATYTWIRYADSVAGAGISNDPTGKLYIGLAYNKTSATESNAPGDYKWALIKGDQGPQGPQGNQGNQGVQGPIGPNGQPTYTWIKYSDNANGAGLYDTPRASTLYIGIAPNKTIQAEGDNPADYLWSRFKGETGEDSAFAAYKLWTFDESLEGWTNGGVGHANVQPGAGYMSIVSTGTDPIAYSPSILIGGAVYDKVRMRVRRTGGDGWDGCLFYWNERHTDNGAYLVAIPDTTKLNEWVVLEWDMAKAADNDWRTSTITRLRLDLGSKNGDVFDVDWIAIGKYQPASSIETVAAAKAAADAALAAAEAMSADGVLDRGEKAQLVTEWAAINAEWAELRGQAATLGVPFAAYDAARQETSNYLSSLAPGWDDVSANTSINRAYFRALFADYYKQKMVLLNGLAAKAATAPSLVVGARNLYKRVTPIFSVGSAAYLAERLANGFVLRGVQANNGHMRMDHLLYVDGTYTVSFDVRVSAADGFNLTLGFAGGGTWTISPKTQVQHFSHTFTTSAGLGQYSYIDFTGLSDQFYYFTDFKVAAGHKDTGYSPAPEDVDASIGVAATTANANSIVGMNHFRVLTQGNGRSVTMPTGDHGLYRNGTKIFGVQRSYSLVVIRRSDCVVTLNSHYDVFGDAAAATAFATDLNNAGPESIVIVYTYDEPQRQRDINGIAAAMYRCGASRAIFGSSEFQWQSVYCLVGIPGCGEGNGAEFYQGAVSGDPNAWIDVAVTITNGNYTVTGQYTPRSLKDYGYTGDTDASRGAPAGTQVAGLAAEILLQRANNGDAAAATLANTPQVDAGPDVYSTGGSTIRSLGPFTATFSGGQLPYKSVLWTLSVDEGELRFIGGQNDATMSIRASVGAPGQQATGQAICTVIDANGISGTDSKDFQVIF